MNKKYRILWIDDQHEELTDIKVNAELYGLNLICFKTAKKGIEALKENPYYWDGIILDAKLYDENENETPELKGMSRVINAVSELKSIRIIPLFIFTGQPDTKGDKAFDDIISGHDLVAFSKSTDREKLFNAIKKAADNLPETQLRHKYHNLFMESIDEKLLIEILTILDHNDNQNGDSFNKVRLLFECSMSICKEVSLIDNNIIKVEKARKALYESSEVPSYIRNSLNSFVYCSQDGSHYEDLIQNVTSGKNPYIVPATINGLLSYIIWLIQYRKNYNEKEN